MKFVVSHLDQQMGPFDEQELKMKWAAGEILPIDYVYDEQKQDWILLAERFVWAGKPAVKEEGSAPPPISENTIMKRTPPPKSLQSTFKPAPPTPKVETLKETMGAIRYTEIVPATVRKAEPPPAKPVEKEEAVDLVPAESLVIENPLTVHASPAPTVTLRAPTESVKPAAVATPAGTVKLVDGVGVIDFTPWQPGKVELVVQDPSANPTLKTEPHKVIVKAAEPVEVVWSFQNVQTVGQDVEVTVKALDDRGHLCAHYDDQYLIHIRGPVSHDVVVRLTGGQALVRLNHTKAETWSLSLQYSGAKKVKLPDSRQIEWQPGVATRLVLDGPSEYLAGDPMKVQVRAVDAYGNLARTFQGTVVLEVKAS